MPEHKSEEIRIICNLIVEKMKPAIVILFGSYTRDTWSEGEITEEGVRLILKATTTNLWLPRKIWIPLPTAGENKTEAYKAGSRYLRNSYSTQRSLHQAEGRKLFFTDIIKEGIVLYFTGEITLEKLGQVDPVAVMERAKEVSILVASAENFLEGFYFYRGKNKLNKSVFNLHFISL